MLGRRLARRGDKPGSLPGWRQSTSGAIAKAAMTLDPSKTGPSQGFDRNLFDLKQAELSRRMKDKSRACDIQSRTGVEEILKAEIEILSEWLDDVDRNAREVWEIQGE